MLSIVLHLAAGSQIGLGHLSRCLSLAHILYQKKHKVFVICEGDYVDHREFPFEVHFVKDRDNALDIRQQIPKPKIIISDLFEKPSETDINIYHNDQDINHLIINPQITDMQPPQLPTISQINSCLITMGGADPDQQTEKLCLHLDKKIKYTIVAGAAWNNQRVQNFRKNCPFSVIEIPDTVSMGKCILQHDMVVTMGGTTSYEAMVLGKPVCAIEWKYMTPYVKNLDNENLLTTLGPVGNAAAKLSAIINNPQQWQKCQTHAWQTIDGLGGYRLAKYIQRKTIET
jgi:spore coat polysaccharide biosynthesis predicted glycosyltransferase SpsG